MQIENSDPQEIDKFNALSSQWWNTEGEFKALHQINPLRLQYVIEKTHGIQGKKIIDVGCGGGILSEALAREGAIVTGLDLAKEALQHATLHMQDQSITIEYLCEQAETVAQQRPEQYDIVTCMEMLEHVPNPSSIIAACVKLVKPGGHLFFSTINRNPKAWLMMIVGAEYLTRKVAKGTHHFDKFIRPSELIHELEQQQITTQHITGISYMPLKNDFKLSRDVDVNYILYARK